MLPGERDIVMRQEQFQDLLREAKHERLIQVASNPQPNRGQWIGQVLHWIGLAIVRIGAKVVKWGLKLQRRNLISLRRSEKSSG